MTVYDRMKQLLQQNVSPLTCPSFESHFVISDDNEDDSDMDDSMPLDSTSFLEMEAEEDDDDSDDDDDDDDDSDEEVEEEETPKKKAPGTVGL